MKKIFRSAVAICLIVVTLLSFAGCGAKSDVKKLIIRFEEHCNVLDINSMLECLSPSISKTVNLATDILGLLTNTDTEALLDKLADILTSEKGWSGKEFFSSIQIQIEDVAVHETDATVLSTVNYTAFKKEHSKSATFKCVLKDGKWYISSISFK